MVGSTGLKRAEPRSTGKSHAKGRLVGKDGSVAATQARLLAILGATPKGSPGFAPGPKPTRPTCHPTEHVAPLTLVISGNITSRPPLGSVLCKQQGRTNTIGKHVVWVDTAIIGTGRPWDVKKGNLTVCAP